MITRIRRLWFLFCCFWWRFDKLQDLKRNAPHTNLPSTIPDIFVVDRHGNSILGASPDWAPYFKGRILVSPWISLYREDELVLHVIAKGRPVTRRDCLEMLRVSKYPGLTEEDLLIHDIHQT